MRRLLAPLVVLLLAPAMASAAPERRLTQDPRVGSVTAFGGKVVWSRVDDHGDSHLVELTAEGPRDLPVAPSNAPFEFRLGPDSDGHPVLVYHRCVDSAPHCDLYKFDFQRSRETRLAGISTTTCYERQPAIWKGTIVFTRYDFPAGCKGGLYVAEPNGKVRRLLRARLVWQPDIRGGLVAYGYSPPVTDALRGSIRIMSIPGGRSRVVAEAQGDRYLYPLVGSKRVDASPGYGFAVSHPVLYGTHVYWTREDIAEGTYALGRRGVQGRSPTRYASQPLSGPIGSLEISGGRLFYTGDGSGVRDLPLPAFSRR